MPGFKRSVEIDAPPDAVFDFMADIERTAPLITKGVQSAAIVDGGPLRQGSVVRETRTLMGRTETYDMTCSAFERPSRVQWTTDFNGSRFVYTFTLEPASDAGTRANLEARAELNGLMARLFGPLSMWFMKKADGELMTNLKTRVEHEKAHGPG